MQTKTTVLVDNVRFPEVPRWHDNRLWFSDFFLNRVMNVDLDGRVEVVAELPNMPAGLGWTSEGSLLIVSAPDRRLLRLEGDDMVEVADLSALVEYPNNDMVVDDQGRAYIGNMGFHFGDPSSTPKPGSLLLITPQGEARIVADGLGFPNGMVITPDGKTLIVAESHTARLAAFTIEPDGSLSGRRAWAQFHDEGTFGAAEGQIVPDGICLDAEGAVWLACPNTRQVIRVREGGEMTTWIAIDSIPLACMLGGPGRKTLFITTTDSLNPFESGALGRIEVMEVDVPGAGLP